MDIELSNVTMCYEGNIVLNNINTVFKEKETTCIMGSSGCGKTTLLNILMNLETRYQGTIKGLQNKKISAVFQENRLCENMNALKNVKLVCKKVTSNESIERAFKAVGLEQSLHQPVNALSGGMKRRVALVRALLSDYDVLILDEPFKGLDLETKEQVVNFIKEQTDNKTVLVVTHRKEDVKFLNGHLYKLQ